MSEYTPTTGHIRDFWATGGTYIPAAKGQSYEECFSEFDRWLAEREAEVAKAERKRIIEKVKAYATDRHFIGVWIVLDIIKGETSE